MFDHLIIGVTLGFSGAVLPGLFQTYIISQSLKNGWKRTLPAALAPLISDIFIIALVLLVLSSLPSTMLQILRIVGGLFILYLAWCAFSSWRRLGKGKQVAAESSSASFAKAVVMNLLNPNPYIYWSFVTGPILLDAWKSAPSSGIAFLAAFYSALVGVFALTIMIFGAARHLGEVVNRILLGLSSAALLILGLYQLWEGVFGSGGV